MRARLTCLALAVVAAVAFVSADQSDGARTLMEAARKKEVVDGDLKGAIQQYQAIAEKYKSERAVVADALVRMAECYQKLGNGEARKIYERLVRDFGDQKDAVTLARARLGSKESVVAASKGDRSVWSGPDADGFGTISQDGRFLTYTDWRHGGQLVLRNLETGADRPITDTAQGSTQFSVMSKDGKEVVYQWYARAANSPAQLRVSSLQTTGRPADRSMIFKNDVKDIAPYDWSADGKWLAVAVSRPDRTIQIGLVAVQDASLRVLKSTDWKEPTKIFFSPDCRYIAYDLPVSETTNERHVFVMATDGSRETAAVAHPSRNVIMGWSHDGRHLLFASDRGGPTGLWALPMDGGKPAGPPSLVQPDTAASWSLGATAAGTMYAWKDRRGLSVQTAAIDLTAGKLLPSPAGTPEQFIRSRGRPEWSPDGKQIVYQSCDGLGGGPCELMFWSLETGQVRQLPTRVKYQFGFSWSPDGRSLITMGTDFRGRRGIYRIDTQTGDSTQVVDGVNNPVVWATDGRSIYYRTRDARGDARGMLVIMQRDLTSGMERELLRTPADDNAFRLSPDQQSVAYTIRDKRDRTMLVKPIAGGEPRIVFRATEPDEMYPASWTPDGRHLLVVKMRDGKPTELWFAAVDGSQPRKIDGDIDSWTQDGGVRLSPDGKQVTFVHSASKAGHEIWALESYLTRLRANR